MDPNSLYYGDNLDILRRYIQNESVDLVYLDPPFKSNQTFNVLFQEKDGSSAASQIKAFEDTWHWDETSARSHEETVEAGGQVAETMQAFRQILGPNDMLAYLSMMAPRLVELRRVLKSTGSLYLHCDPTASHYLKLLLDAVFGPKRFQSEIVWRRSLTHGGTSKYNAVHDVLFYFTKTDVFTWSGQYRPYDQSYLESHWKNVDKQGRRYQLIVAHGAGPGPSRRFGDKMLNPSRG